MDGSTVGTNRWRFVLTEDIILGLYEFFRCLCLGCGRDLLRMCKPGHPPSAKKTFGVGVFDGDEIFGGCVNQGTLLRQKSAHIGTLAVTFGLGL